MEGRDFLIPHLCGFGSSQIAQSDLSVDEAPVYLLVKAVGHLYERKDSLVQFAKAETHVSVGVRRLGYLAHTVGCAE